MSALELAVAGATLVTPRGFQRAHLGVADGRIAVVARDPLDADRQVDATGLFVLPGMVDTHVHLMDPGDIEREDFPTGTTAAAAAGVTTVVEHTHSHPVRSRQELREKLGHLAGRAHVDFGLAAHLWPDRLGDLADLWSAGVTFFKIFTCTTHGVPALRSDLLVAAFERLAELGARALVHCEDEDLTTEAERLLRAAGRTDPGVILEWRTREAELLAASTVALLTKLTGAATTIAHVSSPEVAHVVQRERAEGADIALEACPQYILLREDEVLVEGSLRKFTPPARARTEEDQVRMWTLLRSGVLTHVATDHAPSTRAQKSAGDIWDAPFGLPGLDTTLALLLDAAAEARITYADVVRVYAEEPARRYGLFPAKGQLAVGADADLVLVDPSEQWQLDDAGVRSKAGWTPYAGRLVRGSVKSTFLRGELIFGDGEAQAEPTGRFIPGPGSEGRR